MARPPRSRAWALLLSAGCAAQPGPPPPAQKAAPTAAAAAPLATIAPAVRSIAVGRAHSCAVMPDASVRCWGANGYGQLGDGSQRTRSTPVRVRGLPPVRTVEAADDHSCAITEAGQVYCWGLVYGEWPELERGQGFSATPALVGGLGNVTQLSLGKVYAAALDRDGKVFQWGGETRSMGVDRSLRQRTTPITNQLAGSYRQLAIGRSLLCAATDSSVTCAMLYTSDTDGYDYDCVGKIKNDPRCQPFTLGFEKPEIVTIAQIDATSPEYDPFRDDAVCAAGADGSFGCARRLREQASTEGGRWSRFEPLPAPPIRSARGALALGRAGELFKIGFGLHSACSADGCKLRRLPLDELTRGGDQAALGAGHSCVVRGPAVVCWGDNTSGQLGNGSRSPSSDPQPVKLGASEATDEAVDLRASYAALRSQLPAKKKLSGFGLVFANAELFESATAPKSLGRLASLDDSLLLEQGEPRYLVSITEDRGERIGVRLIPSGKAEKHCAGALPLPAVALRGYVARDALAPVVTKRTRIALDDDWVELLPGTPVYVGKQGRSALVFGERVPLDVPDSALGLSYTLAKQRKLDNEGTVSISVGGQIFKKLAGNFDTKDEGVEREDGGERQRVSDTCSDAMASSLSFGSLPVPASEEREWGFGWVDAGVASYFKSDKRAGEVSELLHLRADKLDAYSSRSCFRAVGEIELCFDNNRIHDQRDE